MKKTSKTLPIGSIFRDGATVLKVKEVYNCVGCHYNKGRDYACMADRTITGECLMSIRKDRKSTIFKRLKVLSWLVKIWEKLKDCFSTKCPACKSGNVHQVGVHGVGMGTSVYECNECGEQYI